MRCPSLSELPPPPAGKSGWPWTKESPRFPEHFAGDHPSPRVSIVTPSYNQGSFIEETIRSVLLQGYPDLEYIIMDGGSSDQSVDIIRKYEPWLRRWVSRPDQGQTRAINEGWSYATGNILAYINSDDTYVENAVAIAVQAFHVHPRAGMVYGSAIVTDESGEPLRIWKAEPFDLRVMLAQGSSVPQPATFYAADGLKQLGYLDERWHLIMDYELCTRLGLRFPTVCLPATLARFRDHPQSKTHAHFVALGKELVDFLVSFSPGNLPQPEWEALKQRSLARVYYESALSYLASGREFPLQALQELAKSVRQSPLCALRHPLTTCYILKELLLRFLAWTLVRHGAQTGRRGALH